MSRTSVWIQYTLFDTTIQDTQKNYNIIFIVKRHASNCSIFLAKFTKVLYNSISYVRSWYIDMIYNIIVYHITFNSMQLRLCSCYNFAGLFVIVLVRQRYSAIDHRHLSYGSMCRIHVQAPWENSRAIQSQSYQQQILRIISLTVWWDRCSFEVGGPVPAIICISVWHIDVIM